MSEPGQAIWGARVTMMDAAQDELEAAVREHARTVYKVAYAVSRHHHDAEDVTQETFLRFWRHRKHWPEIRGRRAWLARTAWRVAVDSKRGHMDVAIDDVAEVVRVQRARGADAETIAASREMLELLQRLIAALPSELRQVVALSSVEELTAAEIGEIVGIPEGSVRNRMFRARQMLREKLAAVLGQRHGR